MRSRWWRYLVLFCLLAGGAGAAWPSWNASRQLLQLDHSQRDLSNRVDALVLALDAATTAQQLAGSASEPGRTSTLLEQLHSETEALRPHLRSVEGGRALQSVASAVSTLRDVDTRAQEHLRLGQDLMAADLIFSEARPAEETAASGLRAIRVAENDEYAIAGAETLDRVWTIAGAVAAAWVLGLILLTGRSPVVVKEETTSAAASHLLLAPTDVERVSPGTADLDLQSAADVCTAIGRLASAKDLPRLLQRAAEVMDAFGVVVWMAAGEELFAAAAFGYPPHVIQKLGPINRVAVNATAAAWRTGALQTVSSEGAERGALAAPMLGPDRCIGVLAVEVGVGRESDAATRAVTTLVAAQLAAALAGWPAASAAAPIQVPPLDTAAEA
jgi:hypothetical protein